MVYCGILQWDELIFLIELLLDIDFTTSMFVEPIDVLELHCLLQTLHSFASKPRMVTVSLLTTFAGD